MKRPTPTIPKKIVFTLVFVSVILSVPNFIPFHLKPLPIKGHDWEVFDRSFAARHDSWTSFTNYIDSEAEAKGMTPTDIAYGNLVAGAVRKRFYHGYSHYSVNENWIAALAGKFFWDDLSAIVLPEHLLRYPMAACSQQSIVLMELFRRKGIDFRKVGFDHHFALEGKFNNRWYFFDPDMEPDFDANTRASFALLRQKQAFYKVYSGRLDSAAFRYMMGNQFYGNVNAAPAPKASLFHQVSFYLSKLLWTLPLAVLCLYYYRRWSHRKIILHPSTDFEVKYIKRNQQFI